MSLDVGLTVRSFEGPSIKSYWLRCASSAMTMMLRRLDNSGAFPPFSSGMNFWMVVKTTPPLATLSSLRRCSTESACTGVCRRISWQRWN